MVNTEVMRDVAKHWKGSVQSKMPEHLDSAADEIDRLRAEIEQERDIRQDREGLINLIAKEMGVLTEPHQTFFERVLNEATFTKARVRELEEAVDYYLRSPNNDNRTLLRMIVEGHFTNSEKED